MRTTRWCESPFTRWCENRFSHPRLRESLPAFRVWRSSLTVVLIGMACLGCSSGRLGTVYVYDGAVAADETDTDTPRTGIWCRGPVTALAGRLVWQRAASEWVATSEEVSAVRRVRTSRMRTEQRLPKEIIDHVLRAFDTRNCAAYDVPSPDTTDEMLDALLLNGEALIARVTDRYIVRTPTTNYRYYRYRLPTGGWEALPDAEGRRAFPRELTPIKVADLRRSRPATRPATTQPAGVTRPAAPASEPAPSGDWGQVLERQASGGWDVIYIAPGGAEYKLLSPKGWGK